MRTVQAQRRLLEEQHAAPPPAKATPAIAVGAPGTVTKAVAKTPKPTPPKVPEEVPLPIAVPIVETPKVTSKTEPPKEPVAKPAPVKVATPEPEPEVVVLEQTPVEVKIPVPAPVIEEAPVIETPLVEPVKAEGVFVQEDEPIIAAAEPVTEVTLPAEVPGAAPVETQVVLEETPVETTKTEQTHEVFEPETKVEAENTAFTEEHTATEEIKAKPQSVEDPGVEELSVDAAEKEVKADVVCTLSHEAESVQDKALEATADEVKVECDEAEPVEAEFVLEAQAVTQCATPQSDPDPVAAKEEEEEAEVEVLSEDEATEEAPAETDITAEDVPAPINKLPVVQNTLPEAPLEKALAPVPQVEKVPVDTADVMVDDFVVTDSLEVIEPKPIELVPGFEKSTGAVWEIFGPGPVMVTSEEREPAIPAEKTIISVAAEKCSDVEDPKSEKCELPCPMQLSAESVQLTSVETSVEAALNGHFVPELSIES